MTKWYLIRETTRVWLRVWECVCLCEQEKTENRKSVCWWESSLIILSSCFTESQLDVFLRLKSVCMCIFVHCGHKPKFDSSESMIMRFGGVGHALKMLSEKMDLFNFINELCLFCNSIWNDFLLSSPSHPSHTAHSITSEPHQVPPYILVEYPVLLWK